MNRLKGRVQLIFRNPNDKDTASVVPKSVSTLCQNYIWELCSAIRSDKRFLSLFVQRKWSITDKQDEMRCIRLQAVYAGTVVLTSRPRSYFCGPFLKFIVQVQYLNGREEELHPRFDTMISLDGFHQAKSLCQAFNSSRFSCMAILRLMQFQKTSSLKDSPHL